MSKTKSRMRQSLLIILVSLFAFSQAPGQVFPRNANSEEKIVEQRANALIRLGRVEEAVDLYLELLYKNPRNSNLYFRVTSLLPGKENASTLLLILDDLLVTQSNNTRLVADRGRLLYLLDRKVEALESWTKPIEVNGADRFLYTTITNSMLQAGASDEAINILNAGRVKLKDPLAFAYELARIYAAKHNYDLASKEYLSHLNQNPGMLDHISNQLIRLLENDGSFEIIDRNFELFLQSGSDQQPIILARAKLLLHQKQYAKCAATVLSSDVSKSIKHVLEIANDLAAEKAWIPAGDLYLYVSANSQDKRQTGEALLKLASTYEYRLKREASYPSLAGYFEGNRFLELDVQFATGQDASLERTLKLYDSLQTLLPQTREAFEASFHIAEIQLTVSGDVDRAIRGFQNILKKARQGDMRLQAGKRLVDAWLVKGDTTAAIATLHKITRDLNLDEDDARIVASRIKILIHKGDLPALNKELLNLSGAASPGDAIFNDGLELMALIDGNGELDDPQLLRYMRAEKFIGQHKMTEAIDVLLEIRGPESSIADEAQVRAIQILLALDKSQQAVEQMDAFLSSFPESGWRANILIWRGEYLQFVTGNPAAAIPFYEEVIINHPGYLGVQELRVRLRSLIGAGS